MERGGAALGAGLVESMYGIEGAGGVFMVKLGSQGWLLSAYTQD